jgi:hypothetical protein
LGISYYSLGHSFERDAFSHTPCRPGTRPLPKNHPTRACLAAVMSRCGRILDILWYLPRYVIVFIPKYVEVDTYLHVSDKVVDTGSEQNHQREHVCFEDTGNEDRPRPHSSDRQSCCSSDPCSEYRATSHGLGAIFLAFSRGRTKIVPLFYGVGFESRWEQDHGPTDHEHEHAVLIPT